MVIQGVASQAPIRGLSESSWVSFLDCGTEMIIPAELRVTLMDRRESGQAAVHGVAEGRTRLSNFIFTFHFHALEKEIATNSSVLTWRIPGTREPGGLLSMGSHRVGHN